MADANIRAIITAKDEASAVLKRVGGQIEHVGGQAKDFLGSAVKTAGLAAAVGIGVATAAAIDMVNSFNDSEKVSAQLNAVLKSTGGAAGVTAKAAEDLASSLQKVTTYSDEQILSAENLLLTFTKINKDIFPDTTKIVLDMSTALGQDLKSSAIQVGKALQDPILGVTALRRVGVNFSEAQAKVIKNLVETGKSAEAQALIMKELQTEFGGSAEAAGKTFAGSLKRLSNQLDDVKERIGLLIVQAITPLVTSLANFVQTEQFNRWVQNTISVITTFGNVLVAVFSFIQNSWTTVADYIANNQVLQQAFTLIGLILRDIGNIIATQLAPQLQQLLVNYGPQLQIMFKVLGAVAIVAFTAALGVIDGLLRALNLVLSVINKIKAGFDSISGFGTNAIGDLASKIPGIGNIGKRASGGPVVAGQPYMVGEVGKEMFVPSTNGKIIPNNQLKSGGSNQTVNVTFNGVFTGNEQEFRKLAVKMMGAFNDAQGMGNI